jgi:hypothetical protein
MVFGPSGIGCARFCTASGRRETPLAGGTGHRPLGRPGPLYVGPPAVSMATAAHGRSIKRAWARQRPDPAAGGRANTDHWPTGARRGGRAAPGRRLARGMELICRKGASPRRLRPPGALLVRACGAGARKYPLGAVRRRERLFGPRAGQLSGIIRFRAAWPGSRRGFAGTNRNHADALELGALERPGRLRPRAWRCSATSCAARAPRRLCTHSTLKMGGWVRARGHAVARVVWAARCGRRGGPDRHWGARGMTGGRPYRHRPPSAAGRRAIAPHDMPADLGPPQRCPGAPGGRACSARIDAHCDPCGRRAVADCGVGSGRAAAGAVTRSLQVFCLPGRQQPRA